MLDNESTWYKRVRPVQTRLEQRLEENLRKGEFTKTFAALKKVVRHYLLTQEPEIIYTEILHPKMFEVLTQLARLLADYQTLKGPGRK